MPAKRTIQVNPVDKDCYTFYTSGAVGAGLTVGTLGGSASLVCQGCRQMVGMAVGASVAAPVGSSMVEIGVGVGSKIDRMGVGESASVAGGTVGLRRMSAVGVAVATAVDSGGSVGAGVGSGGVAGTVF